MIRFEDLLEKVRAYAPDADVELLRRAYVFSAFEHKGQVRHSGVVRGILPEKLLELLLRRPGRLVRKEQLVDHLCGWGEEVSANAIEVYVHRLRKKLDRGGVRISTVRGAGYRLDTLAAEAR